MQIFAMDPPGSRRIGDAGEPRIKYKNIPSGRAAHANKLDHMDILTSHLRRQHNALNHGITIKGLGLI
jgi:hypothetical protein